MRVLVTGSTGFIGSHLCKALVDSGHHVRAFHRPESPLDLLNGIPVEKYQGNITEPATLVGAMDGIEVVFHAAAQVGRRNSGQGYETTVLGTRHILRAALNAGVRRFIHTSSVAALGIPFEQQKSGKIIPSRINEYHSWNYTQAGWPYGYYKHLAEREVQYAVANGLDVVIVNPALVIGAGDINQIAGNVLIRLAATRLPFSIDGGITLIHIDDVVNGHLAALEKGRTGERYILSSEFWTLTEFFSGIKSAVGKTSPNLVISAKTIHSLVRPARSVASFFSLPQLGRIIDRLGYYFYYDNQKALEELGLRDFVPVQRSIMEALNWYQSRGLSNV